MRIAAYSLKLFMHYSMPISLALMSQVDFRITPTGQNSSSSANPVDDPATSVKSPTTPAETSPSTQAPPDSASNSDRTPAPSDSSSTTASPSGSTDIEASTDSNTSSQSSTDSPTALSSSTANTSADEPQKMPPASVDPAPSDTSQSPEMTKVSADPGETGSKESTNSPPSNDSSSAIIAPAATLAEASSGPQTDNAQISDKVQLSTTSDSASVSNLSDTSSNSSASGSSGNPGHTASSSNSPTPTTTDTNPPAVSSTDQPIATDPKTATEITGPDNAQSTLAEPLKIDDSASKPIIETSSTAAAAIVAQPDPAKADPVKPDHSALHVGYEATPTTQNPAPSDTAYGAAMTNETKPETPTGLTNSVVEKATPVPENAPVGSNSESSPAASSTNSSSSSSSSFSVQSPVTPEPSAEPVSTSQESVSSSGSGLAMPAGFALADQGETWQDVSRRVFGDDRWADLVWKENRDLHHGQFETKPLTGRLIRLPKIKEGGGHQPNASELAIKSN